MPIMVLFKTWLTTYKNLKISEREINQFESDGPSQDNTDLKSIS
jgi:hypothetical protein